MAKSLLEQEIKSEIMDKIEEAVDAYLASYKEKKDGKVVPNIYEIEGMLSELGSNTRKIYLDMLSKQLTNTDDSELIESKKEN
ncbi:MAG: hypothetical protein IJ229_01415 [Clostridia bacterium]|nr:hypothetical protein [Clostridia bacterium]